MPDLMDREPVRKHRAGASKTTRDTVKPIGKADLMALVAGMSDPGGMVTGALGDTPATQRINADKAASPNAAFVGDLLNPMSLLPMIKDAGVGLYEAGRDLMSGGEEPPKLKSRDEFMGERRTKGRSLEEAVETAKKDYQNSPAYLAMIKANNFKASRKNLADVAAQAEAAWKAGQGTKAAENAKLEADYKSYAAGFDRELEEFHGRDFADRNPGLAKALPLVGTAAAGLLTKGMFNKIAKTGKDYVDDAEKALREGRMGDFATAQGKVTDWQGRAGKQKAAAVAAGATVPLDIRAAGDLQDKYGLSREYQDSQGEWQRGRAQQTAEEKLGDPLHYMVDGIPALISGGIGAGIGAKFANRTPDIEANSIKDLLTNTSAAKLEPLLEARARLTQANRGPTELPQFQPTRPQAPVSGSSGAPNMGLLDDLSSPPLSGVPVPLGRQSQTLGPHSQPIGPQQAVSSAPPTDLLANRPQSGQASGRSIVGPSIPRKPRATSADRDLLAGDVLASYQKGDPLDIERLVNGSNLSKKQAEEIVHKMKPLLDLGAPREEIAAAVKEMLARKGKLAVPGAMVGGGLLSDQSGGY